MLLVAPGCLYIFCGEKVNRNSPLRSQLLSNCFRQFCITNQACYVPPSGFRINPRSTLPGLRSTPSFPASPRSADAHGQGTGQKDTARDHRLAIHESKGKLGLQEDHGGLDEVLAKPQHDRRYPLGLKETTVGMTEAQTLLFWTTGIRQPDCQSSF